MCILCITDLVECANLVMDESKEVSVIWISKKTIGKGWMKRGVGGGGCWRPLNRAIVKVDLQT